MSFAGVSIVGEDKVVGHAINVATASGYHLLVVNGFSKGATVNGKAIYSLDFMVGSHSWRIEYYPKDDNSESDDSLSIYLRLVDKDVTGPLKVRFVFSFVDEPEKQTSSYIRAMNSHNFSSTNLAWGYRNFRKRDALEKSNHLKDDSFTIRCDIAIATPVDIFIKVPPSSMLQNMSDLLQSTEDTDVKFKVGGETFFAHRCMLAARSMVFKAELFGHMGERTIESDIEIEDMEAKVFGAVLRFIYTDSLPKMELDMAQEEGVSQEALWLQHLLAAADRYDLQRLKVLCQEKLCEHIDTGSVATILTLADQHNCCGLKEVCFDFLMAPANLKAITAVDGLEDITRTCPSLLKELIAKLAI